MRKPEDDAQGIFIPAGLSDERVLNAAECRYDGRLPTLSYVNQKTGFQIWRCSELRLKSMGTDQALDDVAVLDELQK